MATEVLESGRVAAAEVSEPERVEAWPIDETYDHYEIVDGARVELPPMGAYEIVLASTLDQFLGPHVRRDGLGRTATELLFDPGAGLPNRRPDLAFVSYERWPKGRRVPSANAWPVVPDLVVEVVSRTNYADEVIEKVQEYLRAGVRLVWVVYTTIRQVYVFDSPTSIRIIPRDGTLSGGDVVPGFALPLTTLFEDEDG